MKTILLAVKIMLVVASGWCLLVVVGPWFLLKILGGTQKEAASWFSVPGTIACILLPLCTVAYILIVRHLPPGTGLLLAIIPIGILIIALVQSPLLLPTIKFNLGVSYTGGRFLPPVEQGTHVPLTRDAVMSYLASYNDSGQPIDKVLVVDTPDEIRGVVNGTEFQWTATGGVLIVRQSLDRQWHSADPKFKKNMMAEIDRIGKEDPNYFNGAFVEDDATAGAIDVDRPEVLNLRYDITDADMSQKQFASFVDDMATFAGSFQTRFDALFSKVSQESFDQGS